jgi:hypothetical protein
VAPGAVQLRDTELYPGTAALVFSMPITQVQSGTPTDLGGSPAPSPSSPHGDSALPFLYQIGATDDESRERLYQAMHGHAQILGISLLYPSGDGGSLVSDALARDVLLVRTNLSTENQAKSVSMLLAARVAASPGAVDFALLTDPVDFLLLIWEVSVVNADGYYLYYRTQSGAGLPDRLFQNTAQKTDGSGTAPVPETSGYVGMLTVVVEFAPAAVDTVPVPQAANAVLADATLSGKAARLAVLGPNNVPLPSYYSGFQPGDLGFRLQWEGRNTASSPREPIPVGELYQLIQFTVVDPDASPHTPVAWSLPLNPMTPSGSTGSSAASPSPDTGASVFQQVFPAYRFLTPGASPQPSPISSPGGGNWYDLVGRSVTLDFRLCDIFGNALPQAAQTVQTGVYHDPIVNLGQFPFVHADHVFRAGSGGLAQLLIGLGFDGAALSDLGGSPVSPGNGQTARLLSLQARYAAIAFQLADPGTSYGLATSLAVSGTLPVDPRPVLSAFVADILAAIAAALGPHPPVPQPITATLPAEVPLAGIGVLPANIGAVTVALRAKRDPARAAPNAATLLSDIVTSSFDIPPQQGSDLFGSPIASPGGKTAIAAYAMSFEAAFANFDGAGGALKIAERAGVAVNDSTQQAPTLWFVRFGGDQASPTTGGIRTAFTGAMTYYALRPLNTTPRTQTVGDTTYNDIDMDLWAATFFSAADALFAPQLAVAIALLDEAGGTDNFGRLRAAKQKLAGVVPSGLALVLDGDPAGNVDDAREALRQAMLDTLASAVTVSVVAQAEAELSVIGQADGISPARGRPPEFYGRVGTPAVIQSPHAPTSPGASTTNVYTISPGRLNVANGTQWGSVLISVAQPGQHVNLTLPLDYEISYMQHDFETAEIQDGYVPSSWLKFAIPGARPLVLPISEQPAHPDGVAVVPIPLPYEPAAPVLLAQSGFGSGNVTSPSSPIDLSALIAAALVWTYQIEQSADLAAQDTLYFDVTFNGGGPMAFGVEADPLAALFTALADFRIAYPAFQSAVPAILAEAYGVTSPRHAAGSPESPAEVLKTIVTSIGAVADAWPDRAVQFAALGVASPPPGLIHHRLRLQPNLSNTVITVTLEARTPSNGNPDIWPSLRSADGVLDWTPDRRQAKETPDGWWELSTTVPASTRLTDLTFSWEPLTLGATQSAAYECWVIRNAELVEGRTTNQAFVYETSKVKFNAPEVPLITCSHLPPIPAGDPLETMLDQILVPLGPQNSALSPVLNFRVDYSFAVASPAGGGPPLLADTPILVIDDLDMLGRASPGLVAADLARAIKQWHRSFHGPLAQGCLRLSLTLFGTVMDQQLPLVQIDPLLIDVSDVPPSWWQ